MRGEGDIAGMAGQRGIGDMAGGPLQNVLTYALFHHRRQAQPWYREPRLKRFGRRRLPLAARFIESLTLTALMPVLTEIDPTGVAETANGDHQERASERTP